jgi:hypothetical protein
MYSIFPVMRYDNLKPVPNADGIHDQLLSADKNGNITWQNEDSIFAVDTGMGEGDAGFFIRQAGSGETMVSSFTNSIKGTGTNPTSLHLLHDSVGSLLSLSSPDSQINLASTSTGSGTCAINLSQHYNNLFGSFTSAGKIQLNQQNGLDIFSGGRSDPMLSINGNSNIITMGGSSILPTVLIDNNNSVFSASANTVNLGLNTAPMLTLNATTNTMHSTANKTRIDNIAIFTETCLIQNELVIGLNGKIGYHQGVGSSFFLGQIGVDGVPGECRYSDPILGSPHKLGGDYDVIIAHVDGKGPCDPSQIGHLYIAESSNDPSNPYVLVKSTNSADTQSFMGIILWRCYGNLVREDRPLLQADAGVIY